MTFNIYTGAQILQQYQNRESLFGEFSPKRGRNNKILIKSDEWWTHYILKRGKFSKRLIMNGVMKNETHSVRRTRYFWLSGYPRIASKKPHKQINFITSDLTFQNLIFQRYTFYDFAIKIFQISIKTTFIY